MLIATQSVRLRRIIRFVLSRMPDADRDAVARVVRWIRSEREWHTFGLSELPDRMCARLVPLISLEAAKQQSRQGAIEFFLPICRLFSDEALLGIVAHELAHAVRAAKIGTGWYERMDRRWRVEEREADAIATRWGFGRGIRSMRVERTKHVDPIIRGREREISRRIHKLNERRDAESRKRFEALRKGAA
jgi:hypothetical protein